MSQTSDVTERARGLLVGIAADRTRGKCCWKWGGRAGGLVATPRWLQSPSLLAERIDHAQALIVLSVAQILGVHDVAAAGTRGGENRTVPVRQPEALTERDAGAKHGERDVLNREFAYGLDEP